MELIFLCIIFGIPAIFLILFIKNLTKVLKLKKNEATIEKSLIIKTIIFGTIFTLIFLFYLFMTFSLMISIANM